MPKPPEGGGISFDPPLLSGSEDYRRAWALLIDMGLNRSVLFHTVGFGAIRYLGFETKHQAIMFKLRF